MLRRPGPIALVLAGCLPVVLAAGALAHDIYSDLLDAAGRPCCGGDPVMGDCEAVRYRLRPDGDAEMFSARYGAWVHVARGRIAWTALPGSGAEAHWCGRPRTRAIREPTVTPRDPDPDFVTFCAFIAPRGS
jgi:hypothetical protein